MGIPSLASYARQKAGISKKYGGGDRVPAPQLDSPVTVDQHVALPLEGLELYIDGDGFGYAPSVNTRCEMGGSYRAYEHWIREHLNWLQRMGATVYIVWDGKPPDLKDATAASRDREYENDALRLFDMLHSGEDGYLVDQNRDVAGDELFFIAYKCTVNDLNLIKIYAKGEAELEIADRVRAKNAAAGREVAFAYGDDSDFMALRDCPYIMFGDLVEWEERLYARRVWRRSETAALLGFTSDTAEADFIEFCLAMGNDFVHKEVDKSHVFVTPELSLGPTYRKLSNIYGVKRCEHVANRIRENVPVRLFSDIPSIEHRLQYSRQFYEMGFGEVGVVDGEEGVIAEVDIDSDDDDDDEEDYDGEEPPAEGDSPIKQDCFRWLSSAQNATTTSLWSECWPAEGDVPSAQQLGQEVCVMIYGSHEDAGCLNPGGRLMSERQRVALNTMLDILNDPERAEEYQHILALAPAAVSWQDMLCALRYQLVCERVVRKNYKWNPALTASRLFDGLVFFSLLQQYDEDNQTTVVQDTRPVSALRPFSDNILDLPAITDLLVSAGNLPEKELRALDFPLFVATKRARLLTRLLRNASAGGSFQITDDIAEVQAHVAEYIIVGHAKHSGGGNSCLVFATHNKSKETLQKAMKQFPLIEVMELNGTGLSWEDYRTKLADLGSVKPDKFRVIIARDFRFNPSVRLNRCVCIIDLAQFISHGNVELCSKNKTNIRLGRGGRLDGLPRYLLAPYTSLALSEVPPSCTLYMRLDKRVYNQPHGEAFKTVLRDNGVVLADQGRQPIGENCGWQRTFTSNEQTSSLVERAELLDGRVWRQINFLGADLPARVIQGGAVDMDEVQRVREAIKLLLAPGVAAAQHRQAHMQQL